MREFNSLFPLPTEGILVIKKDSNFYLTPEPVRGTNVIKNEVPVPETMVPDSNIIGQIKDNKNLKFQELQESIRQIENSPTGQHSSVTELMVKQQQERDYYVSIGCKRFNNGGRMIWICPHDLEADKCEICSPKLNITE